MFELRYYCPFDDESPFEKWFSSLDALAAAKVTVALARIELGNLSDAKSVGDGVVEYRIHWGPGYRLYSGRDGAVLVILLLGGTKKRQQDDIKKAKLLWAAYKRAQDTQQELK
jgi:putative addiction module killer protein